MKRYVITTAQANATPNYDFLHSIETYLKLNNAHLIILPTIGKDAKEDINKLHSYFKGLDIETCSRPLNDNIEIENFHVRPYQIDPVTGLSRFVQRETTKVFASPKQRLKPIPHSNKKHAKYLVTTGACTYPNYATGMDYSAERRRLGKIATKDHVYGALIVEVEDYRIYHMRHIRANKKGEFVDLGKKYYKDSVTDSNCDALVLGDYHVGQCENHILEATYKIIKDLKPKRLIIHDFFDGHSVSHHVDKKFIEEKMLHQYDVGHHSLKEELTNCYEELIKLKKIAPKAEIVLVMSNHHEFLNRYLNEGRFMHDPTNFRFALKLAHYMAEKDYNDPVEHGIRMIGKLPNGIRFLKRDEDYKVRGFQLGSHGDKGANGGYGSMQSKENDFGKSISGHVHKAQILRETVTVGTMQPLNIFYTRGHPSDWSHTHCSLWDNGSFQLIMLFDGKYRC